MIEMLVAIVNPDCDEINVSDQNLLSHRQDNDSSGEYLIYVEISMKDHCEDTRATGRTASEGYINRPRSQVDVRTRSEEG